MTISRSTVEARYCRLVDPSRSSALSYNSNAARISLIQVAVGLFSESPFIGKGLANYSTYTSGTLSHNDYAGLLAETGLFGLTCFVLLLTSILRTLSSRGAGGSPYGHQYAIRASVLAMFIHLLFINAYTGIFFWIWLGLLLATNESLNRRRVIASKRAGHRRKGMVSGEFPLGSPA